MCVVAADVAISMTVRHIDSYQNGFRASKCPSDLLRLMKRRAAKHYPPQ